MYWFLAIFYFVGIVAGAAHRALAGRRHPERHPRQSRCARRRSATAVERYKLIAFVIAAAYAGIAGGLLGVLQGFMPPDAFTFETSGQLVMQTVDRRRRHAVRAAARRRRLAVPERLPAAVARPRQRRGSWCWAWSSCCWSCFLRRGLIGGLKDLYEPVLRRRASRGRAAARTRRARGRSRRPHRCRPACRGAIDGAGPILQGDRPHQALWRAGRPTATSTSPSMPASCAASSDRTARARRRSSRC